MGAVGSSKPGDWALNVIRVYFVKESNLLILLIDCTARLECSCNGIVEFLPSIWQIPQFTRSLLW
jgi:hypothetical protein